MKLRYSLANCALLIVFLFVSQGAKAQNSSTCAANSAKTWAANAGAETPDQSKQADAFLPNEVWICQGDSITWTFIPQNEVHTVTFLNQSGAPTAPGIALDLSTKPPTAHPDLPLAFTTVTSDSLVYTPPAYSEVARPQATPPVGPPAGSTSSALPTACGPYSTPQSFTGANCVSSNPVSGGATFKVTFSNAGNYKLVCLVHTNMNGTVHVLGAGAALPFTQASYNQQAREQADDILSDSFNPVAWLSDFFQSPFSDKVTMTGDLTATPGGRHYLAIVRFNPGTIYINAGDTVEFTNADPEEPHTVTFGTELCDGNCPTVPLNVTTAADGALVGTISSTTDSLTSGLIQASPEDGVGRAQNPPGTTRVRITFPNPGTYDYLCALHDVDGMKGKVVVSAPKHGRDPF